MDKAIELFQSKNTKVIFKNVSLDKKHYELFQTKQRIIVPQQTCTFNDLHKQLPNSISCFKLSIIVCQTDIKYKNKLHLSIFLYFC